MARRSNSGRSRVAMTTETSGNNDDGDEGEGDWPSVMIGIRVEEGR